MKHACCSLRSMNVHPSVHTIFQLSGNAFPQHLSHCFYALDHQLVRPYVFLSQPISHWLYYNSLIRSGGHSTLSSFSITLLKVTIRRVLNTISVSMDQKPWTKVISKISKSFKCFSLCYIKYFKLKWFSSELLKENLKSASEQITFTYTYILRFSSVRWSIK